MNYEEAKKDILGFYVAVATEYPNNKSVHQDVQINGYLRGYKDLLLDQSDNKPQ